MSPEPRRFLFLATMAQGRAEDDVTAAARKPRTSRKPLMSSGRTSPRQVRRSTAGRGIGVAVDAAACFGDGGGRRPIRRYPPKTRSADTHTHTHMIHAHMVHTYTLALGAHRPLSRAHVQLVLATATGWLEVVRHVLCEWGQLARLPGPGAPLHVLVRQHQELPEPVRKTSMMTIPSKP